MRYFLPIVPIACERDATIFTSYRDGLLKVVVYHDRGAPVTNLSFQTIHRQTGGSDSGFRLGNRRPLKYKAPVLRLNHDFIQANAEFFNGVKQTDFHAQVVPKSHVLRRVSQQRAGIPLNIVILGLDQTSHATFQRLVRSSYKFLQDELQAFMFNGFSLVGEGTTPQLTALLTGRSLEENCKIHEARTGFKGAGTVDPWPFIFRTLKEYGYATMFSEDAPPIGKLVTSISFLECTYLFYFLCQVLLGRWTEKVLSSCQFSNFYIINPIFYTYGSNSEMFSCRLLFLPCFNSRVGQTFIDSPGVKR